MSTRTTLFLSNRSQAVREVAPADSTWDDFFAGPGVDPGERRQPEAETRDSF